MKNAPCSGTGQCLASLHLADCSRRSRDRREPLLGALVAIAGWRCINAPADDQPRCTDEFPTDTGEWCAPCIAAAALASEETP